MARYASTITVDCPNCGERSVEPVEVPETYWAGDNADERFTQSQEDFSCPNCRQVFLMEVQNSDGTVFVTIVGHEDIDVEASDAYLTEPDLEDFPEPGEIAVSILSTLSDVRRVIDAAATSPYKATVNRMAFIQQFAALEAYLSDTLVSQVLDKPYILNAALSGIKELKDMKLSIAEVNADPDIVKRTVAGHLRDLLYHNFVKIMPIWRATVGFDLFPSSELQRRMFKAVPIRHDCVHRNGKDKDGEERTEVDDAFVSQVDHDIQSIVRHVEGEILLMM